MYSFTDIVDLKSKLLLVIKLDASGWQGCRRTTNLWQSMSIALCLLRFRHIDEFSFQQEQMHKFGGSGSVLGEGGLISYPRGGGGARVPGWDPAPGHQPPAPSTATNAFTPIWPAVPAQKRSLSPSQPAPGSKHFFVAAKNI